MSPICHCAVPSCEQNWRYMKNTRNRTYFAILRPDLARTEQLRRHRQNLTDFILSKRNSPDDVITEMLRKETAGICDLHFNKEDMLSSSKKKRLKMMAIPLDEPRIDGGSVMSSRKAEERNIRFRKALPASIKEDEIVDIMNLDPTPLKKQVQSHPKKRKTKPKIKCVRCGYATRNTDHMNNHVVNFHLQLKTLKCDQCDVTAVSKRLLGKHQEETHKKPDGNSTSRQRVCKCGYKTTSFALFRRHFRFNHLQQFPWTCSLCSYVATTELHLRQHVSQNHEEPSAFICGLCGYRADSRGVIKVHVIRKHLTSLNAQKPKSSSRKK